MEYTDRTEMFEQNISGEDEKTREFLAYLEPLEEEDRMLPPSVFCLLLARTMS